MNGVRAAATSIRAHWGSSSGAEERPDVAGQLRHALHRALGALDALAHGGGPEPSPLQLGHEVPVDLQELAGQGLAVSRRAK
jgi:hypothetical protein